MSQRRGGDGRDGGGGRAPLAQILLVVAAVLLGFLVLRSLDDDGGSAAGGEGDDDTEQSTTSVAATTAAPTTTVDLSTAIVLVANGAGVQGLAGTVSEYLEANGVTNVVEPADADNRYATSAVYYLAGFEEQGQAVADILTIAAVQPFPATLPLADPTKIGTANVLVLLGEDYKAGPPTTTAGAAASTTQPPTPTAITPQTTGG